MHDVNLTVQEAADRLRLSKSTLNRWRSTGEGPKYIKIGHRVVYPVAAIEKFEAGATRQCVREAAE